MKAIVYIITFIPSWSMHIQNDNSITPATVYYVEHPFTKKLSPLNYCPDSLMYKEPVFK